VIPNSRFVDPSQRRIPIAILNDVQQKISMRCGDARSDNESIQQMLIPSRKVPIPVNMGVALHPPDAAHGHKIALNAFKDASYNEQPG
jgi:hypothetical protein